jgi:phage-related protein
MAIPINAEPKNWKENLCPRCPISQMGTERNGHGNTAGPTVIGNVKGKDACCRASLQRAGT